MQKYVILNTSNGQLLAEKAVLANKFYSRLKGLLGKKLMPEGEGLIIYPCTMVHSIGMKINIDVLFMSAKNEIVYIIEGMTPNHVSPHVKNASYVLELPAGQVARTCTAVGQSTYTLASQRYGDIPVAQEYPRPLYCELQHF